MEFDRDCLDPEAIAALSEIVFRASPELWSSYQEALAAAFGKLDIDSLRLEVARATAWSAEFGDRMDTDDPFGRGVFKIEKFLGDFRRNSSPSDVID